MREGLSALVPLSSFCKLADVVWILSSLVSPNPRFVTGATYDIDGGVRIGCVGSSRGNSSRELRDVLHYPYCPLVAGARPVRPGSTAKVHITWPSRGTALHHHRS